MHPVTLMLYSAYASVPIVVAFLIWRRQSVLKGLGFTFCWWALGDLAAGALICFVAMLGIFLMEWALGGIAVEGFRLDVSPLVSAVANQGLTALTEEVVSRSLQLNATQILIGLLLALILGTRLGSDFRLRMDPALRMAVWPAILVIAALFGYVHINNPGATWISAIGNALGGLMYGIAFIGGRNIWLPIGLHFGWNFFQGAVFGFLVSGTNQTGVVVQRTIVDGLLTGGSYGPEAGIVGMAFRFVVIALTIGYLQWRCGNQGKVAFLEFPIRDYDNPPRPPRRASSAEAAQV